MFHFQGLVDSQSLLSEQRTRCHLETKMGADANPIVLSANVTRSLGGRSSFSAMVKNVFRDTASLSGIRPAQRKKDFLCVETLVFWSMFNFSNGSGSRAQTWRRQQAVLCGVRASVTWCGRHQDIGADGAERPPVELCTQVEIQPGRWVHGFIEKIMNGKTALLWVKENGICCVFCARIVNCSIFRYVVLWNFSVLLTSRVVVVLSMLVKPLNWNPQLLNSQLPLK